MRISGTEPSTVILNQTKYFQQLKSDVQKVPKLAEAKRDGVINPQNYNFKIQSLAPWQVLMRLVSTLEHMQRPIKILINKLLATDYKYLKLYCGYKHTDIVWLIVSGSKTTKTTGGWPCLIFGPHLIRSTVK